MKIIGLTGPKGCGKTFIANFIRSKVHRSKILSFASPMRDMMSALMGNESFEEAYKRKEEPNELLLGKSIRHAMQTLGTDWGRQYIGESLWINIAMSRALESSADLVVFDDCRFDNEAEAILDHGGHIIELFRSSCYSGIDKHPSEKGLKRKNISTSMSNEGLGSLVLIENLVEEIMKGQS